MKTHQNIPTTSLCTTVLLLVLGAGIDIATATVLANTTTSSTSTSTAPAPTSTSTAFSGSGTLNLIVFPNSLEGCLLNNGLWSKAGTCGTFTATNSGSSFTLSTSSGNCEISSGLFICQSGISATTFTEVGGFLGFDGSNLFSADVIPSGEIEETINAGIGPNNVIDLNVLWESI